MTAFVTDRLERAFYLISRGTGGGKTIVTTLDTGSTGKRLDGNTTRQVNYAIDQLFKGNAVICLDHYGHGHDDKANKMLFDRVMRRLEREHPGITGAEYIEKNQLYSYLYLKT